MNKLKLTGPQIKLLSRAGVSGGFDVHTGPQKRVAENLLCKDLIRGGMLYPTAPHYRITEAGRDALRESTR